MINDPFRKSAHSPMSPAEVCFPDVPHNNAELHHATKAIYVREAGNVRLVSVRGSEPVTFHNVPAGAILDVRLKEILASGTTARELVVLA